MERIAHRLNYAIMRISNAQRAAWHEGVGWVSGVEHNECAIFRGLLLLLNIHDSLKDGKLHQLGCFVDPELVHDPLAMLFHGAHT